ncbi:MAG: glycosyltransferase, partial [Anaerolineae bacterium]|nr:glycosyltransferase [Anaerolineae bacterium]
DATARVGCRAIISRGWANIGTETLPPHVFALDYAPYAWLFPQMNAVIHHGGSGTTGMALRSGVPSLVVAFGADQPYWGQRTAALGAGLAPLHIKTLTADALATAIQRLTHDATLRRRADEVSAALRREDGIAEAVHWIGEYVGAP